MSRTITLGELREAQDEWEQAYESGRLKVRCSACDGVLSMKDALDSNDGRHWHPWCDWPIRYEAAQTYFELAIRQLICFLEGRDTFGPFGLSDCWEYMDVAATLAGLEARQ